MLSPAGQLNWRSCCFSLGGATNGRRGREAPRVALEGCLLVLVCEHCQKISIAADFVGGEDVVLRGDAGRCLVALVFRRACGTATCGAERGADWCEEQSEDGYKCERTCSGRVVSN